MKFSPFNKEITLLIKSIINEFGVSFQYFYDTTSSSHFFKINNALIWDNTLFQEFKSNKIFDLIQDDFYEGISFLGPNDNTISFEKSDSFGGIPLQSIEIPNSFHSKFEVLSFFSDINWWGKGNKKMNINDIFSPIKYDLKNIPVDHSEQIPVDEAQIPFENSPGNNSYAMAA